MNKQQYAEFNKYLAMLIYEYNEMFHCHDLSEESRTEIRKILLALETVMKICVIDKEQK